MGSQGRQGMLQKFGGLLRSASQKMTTSVKPSVWTRNIGYTPENIVEKLFSVSAIVVVGEDHRDHAAKRLVAHSMPFLAKTKTSFAWEMVRANNPREKEDLRPDQTMIDAFLSGKISGKVVEEAIAQYCNNYGNNMVEEKMGLLYAAKEHGVPVVGIDTSEFSPSRRIADSNPFWAECIEKYRKTIEGKILLLGGKAHIHNVNLHDEAVGDQATGVDKLLGATSLVVHTSDGKEVSLWEGDAGMAMADIELRIPKDYWIKNTTKWASRFPEDRNDSKESTLSL